MWKVLNAMKRETLVRFFLAPKKKEIRTKKFEKYFVLFRRKFFIDRFETGSKPVLSGLFISWRLAAGTWPWRRWRWRRRQWSETRRIFSGLARARDRTRDLFDFLFAHSNKLPPTKVLTRGLYYNTLQIIFLIEKRNFKECCIIKTNFLRQIKEKIALFKW